MNVSSALQTGLQGIRDGQDGALKAATEIVRSQTAEGGVGGSDLAESVVDLKLYERSVEASAPLSKFAMYTRSLRMRRTHRKICERRRSALLPPFSNGTPKFHGAEGAALPPKYCKRAKR